VIAFKLDEILVSGVSVMKLLAMVWPDELVLLAGGEKCWDETLLDVCDGCQFIQVKVGLLSDGFCHERHGGAN